jgi:PhzF family phenazine biosynthesis protein
MSTDAGEARRRPRTETMITTTDPKVRRLAAFSDGDAGGNPAGVVVGPTLPPEAEMQRIATEVGYSETVFAARAGDGWRVRYFSPEAEVGFCGHATVALGAVLAETEGAGVFALDINLGRIAVEAGRAGGVPHATLTSPPTRSAPADPVLAAAALDLLSLRPEDLDPALPPARAHAGNDHLILALRDRATLARMDYDLGEGARLMTEAGLTTIDLLWVETPRLFHSRNAFAVGGVLEDPATGAAAAALAGYLRDLGWPHGGAVEIVQGEDMGFPSRLHVRIGARQGEGIRVAGTVRALD